MWLASITPRIEERLKCDEKVNELSLVGQFYTRFLQDEYMLR